LFRDPHGVVAAADAILRRDEKPFIGFDPVAPDTFAVIEKSADIVLSCPVAAFDEREPLTGGGVV